MLTLAPVVGRVALNIAKPVAIVAGQIIVDTAINVVVVAGTFATIGLAYQAVQGTRRQYAKTIRRLHARLPIEATPA